MNIQLKPFEGANMPLFITWLNCEHVNQWYSPIEAWIDEVNKRSNEYSWIQHFIIYADDEPIGFCQYYPYWRSGEDWNGSIPVEETYSVDYFIGDTRYLRKGCASKALTLLNSIIFKQHDARRIIVKPEEDNIASQKTLLSTGYSYDKVNQLYLLEQ
jgi:RimJ/RimL family protein N-acetyltransferase